MFDGSSPQGAARARLNSTFGDVVNTRHPASFKIRRKTDVLVVETQDARSTNVQVPLDQHIYNLFVIKDGEASKSFQELGNSGDTIGKIR